MTSPCASPVWVVFLFGVFRQESLLDPRHNAILCGRHLTSLHYGMHVHIYIYSIHIHALRCIDCSSAHGVLRILMFKLLCQYETMVCHQSSGVRSYVYTPTPTEPWKFAWDALATGSNVPQQFKDCFNLHARNSAFSTRERNDTML